VTGPPLNREMRWDVNGTDPFLRPFGDHPPMTSKLPSDQRRTKAAPFKKRVEDALEAAKAAGYAHLKVKTPDGATYEFESDASDTSAPRNDFDRPPNSRGRPST
jgi:hypothetical protein